MKKFTFTVILGAFVVLPAAAAPLKITSEYDEFTEQVTYRSKGFTVCQPHSAGPVPCATIRLAWTESEPESVYVNFEIGVLASLRDLSVKVDGQITTFEAANLLTDHSFAADLFGMNPALGQSSRSLFVIPASTLRAVSANKADGLIRVAGVDWQANFDFFRKANFGKRRPKDRLAEFLDYIDARR